MDVDFANLANPGIADLEPYQIGIPISRLQRELGLTDVIKLASNENPLGPSPKAITTYNLFAKDLALYPDGSAYELKLALSRHLNVSMEQITVGNGSDNLLALIAQVFADPGSEIIISQTGFITFSIITKAHQAKSILTAESAWTTNVDAMLNAVTEKTRIIFIANPNNPTGTWIDNHDLIKLLDNLPSSIIVVIDEAYFEFIEDPNYPDTIQLQKRYLNLITTRTFSKVYGLAGLRIGYCIANTTITDLLNRVRLPFNVNIAGQAAATAALDDREHVIKTVTLNTEQRSWLMQALQNYGLNVIPSAANFILVDLQQPTAPIYQNLLSQGIIVRPLLPYQLPNHLRITIGLPEQNQRLVEALNQLL